MQDTATSMGLPLDMDLSCAQRMENGTLRLVASVDTFPNSTEERSISQSALHAELMENFTDFDSVDVHVIIPPASDDPPSVATTGGGIRNLASQRIRVWSEGVHDLAIKSAIQLAASSYRCVVETYPWMDCDAMAARVDMAVEMTISNMATGRPDPLMTTNCVDLILPPLESVLRPDETTVVYCDVNRVLGGTPVSMLEFYEVLFLCGTNGIAVSDTTRAVFHRVFRRM